MSEKQITAAIFQHWHHRGRPKTRIAAIPNARAFGQVGLTKGLPDLLVLAPGLPVGFIEVKREKGRLRPEQMHFKGDCLAVAAPHSVVYGLDQALEILEHWNVLKPARTE